MRELTKEVRSRQIGFSGAVRKNNFLRSKAGRCRIDYALGKVVVEPVVGADYRAAEPRVNDLRLRGDFEDSGESQLLLTGAERTEFVRERLRQHRHGTVNEID